jgi:hypothetical protein
MTLAAQISLIDDLIKENGDVTIRDFLDLLAEIESIEAPRIVTNEKKNRA